MKFIQLTNIRNLFLNNTTNIKTQKCKVEDRKQIYFKPLMSLKNEKELEKHLQEISADIDQIISLGEDILNFDF